MKTKILGLLAIGLLAAPLMANAGYLVTIEQVGSDVVATGGGSLNLGSLTCDPTPFTDGRRSIANFGLLILGEQEYASPITACLPVSGPSQFGAGDVFYADSGTGLSVGIAGYVNVLAVPVGYVSGTDLGVSTATWLSHTYASLGFTQGEYVWSWGDGEDSDTFTLRIGHATVPEPGTLALLGLGLAGLGLSRRRKAT